MLHLRSLCLALVAALGLTPAASAITIGSVNLQKITEEWSKSKKAGEEAKAEAARIEAELKKEFEGYKAMMDEADTLRETFRTPAKSPDQEKLGREKIIDLLKRATMERDRLDKKRTKVLFDYNKAYQEKVQSLLKEIQAATATVAKAKGLDLVVDTAGKTSHATSLLIYSPASNDITSDVVQQLETAK
jgi:Skp family chaperone for outer membrane proteins